MNVPNPVLATTFAAVLALALAPAASAQGVQSQVFLHDLTTLDGAYAGCHVTDANFGTYRLTVEAGTPVTLNVQSFANNTNAHTLAVEGESVQVAPGGSGTITFTPSEAGSYDVVCDNQRGTFSGTIIARAPSGGGGGNDAPGAPLALVALALVATAVLARRR